MLSAGAGTDIILTSGGNDIVRGGAAADTIHFGPGYSTLRDSVADLNGDVVREFGFGAVDVLGMRLGWDSVSITATQTTINAGGSTVQLNGSFAGNGAFILSARGSGADAHTALGYVNFLPVLAEGVSVNAAAVNGVADQSFLIGDGAVRFTLEFKSAVSAFANTLGFYKIKADGTIDNVQILFDNTLNVAAGARSVDLGVPGNGERIGFFLIQNGFDAYGDLHGTLSFVAPGTGQAASVDSGARDPDQHDPGRAHPHPDLPFHRRPQSERRRPGPVRRQAGRTGTADRLRGPAERHRRPGFSGRRDRHPRHGRRLPVHLTGFARTGGVPPS